MQDNNVGIMLECFRFVCACVRVCVSSRAVDAGGRRAR